MFYAAQPGAFAALAPPPGWAGSSDQVVVVDGDLPSAVHPARPLGVSGLAELSTYNQAIGVLIAAGHSLPDARAAQRNRFANAGNRAAQPSTAQA